MHYTQLFRSLREAKGLSLEQLARLSRRHRNTVVNVESGRPVKFKTIAELMQKMGYHEGSPELRTMALLWLEAVTGLPFSQPETETAAKKTLTAYRSGARHAAKRLDEAIARASLNQDQINVLLFAVYHPEFLSILESIRDLATDLAAAKDIPALKVAEE